MQQTPHINPTGPIANTVLMPGDPLRAKFIAETFLDDARQFNQVRGMLGYTGTYQGVQVSVMGSGMGIPSISLYAHELIHVYGVKNIIRVGSCGALQEDLDLYDVVVAASASTDSHFITQYDLPGTWAPTASWDLLEGVYAQSRKDEVPIRVGNILSSDVFYNFDETVNARWAKMGVLAVEMESAGLYAVAAQAGARALGVFTVSDNLVTDQHTSASERQSAFTKMIELTLPVAAKVGQE
ncbi:MAG: purine-nucleoside phosphorylase [Winkia neuii]|uniref:purine-nucleoside phosphorylase n=1 Tax=Winkia neuii TaxID=33007 RepID=UPI0029050403|nr:purine-nucleoside phosphorylase [Winkia neuii]MDU3134125.1 purine-nucleoside phosphorylase [Winkia neuii]